MVIRGRVPTVAEYYTRRGILAKEERGDGWYQNIRRGMEHGKSIIRSCGTNQLNDQKICMNCIIFDDHMEPMTLTCLVILTHTGERRRKAKKLRQSAPCATKICTRLELICTFSRASITLT